MFGFLVVIIGVVVGIGNGCIGGYGRIIYFIGGIWNFIFWLLIFVLFIISFDCNFFRFLIFLEIIIFEFLK